MRVAIVSKADHFGGGASAIAESLAKNLRDFSDVETVHINLWRGEKKVFNKGLTLGRGRITKAIRLFEQKTGLIDLIPIELPKLVLELIRFKPNVVHFHDLTSAISPITLRIVSRMFPTCWTLHDMSPITAGCIYVSDCIQWQNGCGKCPQLGTWPLLTKKDRTRFLRKIRKKTVMSPRINLISPSEWLKELVLKDIASTKKVKHINNGVENYDLTNTKIPNLRKEMLLDANAFTIIIVAGDLSDPRKGFLKTLKVLQELHNKKCIYQIILLGNCSLEVLRKLPPVNIYVAGYISDHQTKMKLVSAADILLFMSSEDNQPLTVLEALVQGSAVIGYPTGGVAEISAVEKFPSGDEPRMVERIIELSMKNLDLGARSLLANQQIANFGIKSFTSNHVEFYKEIMTNA